MHADWLIYPTYESNDRIIPIGVISLLRFQDKIWIKLITLVSQRLTNKSNVHRQDTFNIYL